MLLRRTLYTSKLSSLLVVLFASFNVAFLINSIWQKNEYNVYPWAKLKWVVVFTALLFSIGWFLLQRRLRQILDRLTVWELRGYAVASLLTALVITWFWPAATPVIPVTRKLQIISPGVNNESSSGRVIEIRKVRGYDGATISFERFKLSGDWRIQKDRLVSEGVQPGSIAEFSGAIAGGVLFNLRYSPDAGIVQVVLDGNRSEIDLYSERGITHQKSMGAVIWHNVPWQQKTITALAVVFQVIGLTVLSLFLWALSRVSRRFFPVLLVLIYGAIFLSYLDNKLAYSQFNTGRVFRDTYSYVETSEKPITSLDFWIGKRAFTIPLIYKILGLDINNYTDREHLKSAENIQTWLSVVSWTTLALTLAMSMRQTYYRPLAFAFVLFFSLNLEISQWDSLLLSESISFSLFALMLAAWIGMGLLLNRLQSNLLGWVYLSGTAVVTILYSFTRDTNLYFVVAGAGLLMLIALFFQRLIRIPRKYVFVYFGFVVALFFFQNSTIQWGNRWQIHIYDHLALRILPDPQARQYYAEAGLPINQDLLVITDMKGFDYHDYLDFDPRMESVRDWIQQRGRTIFLESMISHPSQAFLEPLRQNNKLINGNNLEYRYPKYPQQPVPSRISHLTEKFYPNAPVLLFGLGVLIVASLYLDWHISSQHQEVWWVLASFIISLYPLMFVVWNGNPMEIERHAAQIGIQYRLAGLVALANLLDSAHPLIENAFAQAHRQVEN